MSKVQPGVLLSIFILLTSCVTLKSNHPEKKTTPIIKKEVKEVPPPIVEEKEKLFAVAENKEKTIEIKKQLKSPGEIDPDFAFLKEDYSSALESYQAIIRKTDFIQYRIGICCLKLGKYKEAEKELKKVFVYSENTFFDRAQFALGEVFFLSKNFQEAIKSYRQIIKEYPKSPIHHLALFKLAIAYLQNKDEEGALKCFKKVRELYPLSFEGEKSNKIINEKEGHFSIQIAAFTDFTKAKNLAADFQKKGYNSYLLKKNEDKPWIYKVRIGNFKNREKASFFTKQLPEKTNFFITKE